MIRGRVTADREALLRLAVEGEGSETQEIEGVIDTGFNGFLTLPGSAIQALGLPFVGHRRATLADGNVAVLDAHMASVLWGEQTREVLVLKAEGVPLIGMELLNGHRRPTPKYPLSPRRGERARVRGAMTHGGFRRLDPPTRTLSLRGEGR